MCENELTLLPFSPLWATLERDVTLVVPYEDIESVKLVDDLLNVIIDIETRGGAVRLTTQQKELSDIRLSGISNMPVASRTGHAENVTSPCKHSATRPQDIMRIGLTLLRRRMLLRWRQKPYTFPGDEGHFRHHNAGGYMNRPSPSA